LIYEIGGSKDYFAIVGSIPSRSRDDKDEGITDLKLLAVDFKTGNVYAASKFCIKVFDSKAHNNN
jgi:hypothetical protein